MAEFEKLAVWIDPLKRTGPEAMAVDEWLLETVKIPLLRVYGWQGNWGSLGYFGKISAARSALPEIEWVRRWTGGGIVDHRADWTYTLVVPAGESLCQYRGAESYQLIHRALREALKDEIDVRLSPGDQQTGADLCFNNPVGHDLVDSEGRKLAGAGQRRTKSGLLHQGSLALPCENADSILRAARFASALARQWERVDVTLSADEIMQKLCGRYADPTWTERC
jgi:lipoyl(octanoyl) transferase